MLLIRVGFAKEKEACYISHLDLQRVIQRALKKAGVPVWYTQGFNPHIYLTFALALSLGQASTCESFDYKCEEDAFDADAVYYALNQALPKGLTVYDVHPAQMDPNEIEYARYLVRFSGQSDLLAQKLAAFRSLPEAVVYKKTKKGQDKPVDLLPDIRAWEVRPTEEGVLLDVTLPAGNRYMLNPDLLIGYLAEHYEIDVVDVSVCRTEVLTKTNELFR